MEPGTFDVESGHLGVGDNDAAGVLASVELAAHSQAGFGGSSRDQLDDDAIADEWLGAPVLTDEREEPVLDFVPLAGAGRQVADHNVEAELAVAKAKASDDQTLSALRARHEINAQFGR